ncbi:MAG: flagellar hook-length control protein FliK [Desulfuromonadaceae bacterium]|nr:flagellar hook-length control protein FliK [Desulfuromonadaceae bacterium]
MQTSAVMNGLPFSSSSTKAVSAGSSDEKSFLPAMREARQRVVRHDSSDKSERQASAPVKDASRPATENAALEKTSSDGEDTAVATTESAEPAVEEQAVEQSDEDASAMEMVAVAPLDPEVIPSAADVSEIAEATSDGGEVVAPNGDSVMAGRGGEKPQPENFGQQVAEVARSTPEQVAAFVQENKPQPGSRAGLAQGQEAREVKPAVQIVQNDAKESVVAVAAEIVKEESPVAGAVQPQAIVEAAEAIKIALPENGKKGKETIADPRFASLLNKPEVPASLRGQNPNVRGLEAAVAPQTGSLESGAGTTEGAVAEGDLLSALTAEGTDEGLAQLPSETMEAFSDRLDEKVQAHLAAASRGSEGAGTQRLAMENLTLKDGSSLPAARIVEQTIEQLVVHSRGESSVVTVRLHPEELGELQLRMVMEGEQLKVHLHAQTQQVQEVLEKNFPRLREALQDQGLTVEDFQVSVDSGQRGYDQAGSQRHESSPRMARTANSSRHQVVESFVAQGTPRAAHSGLSLRV